MSQNQFNNSSNPVFVPQWEGERPSLFDILEDKNKTLNKRSLLHRMVLISKLKHDDFDQIGAYFEKMFKDKQGLLNCEGVTGMCMMYRQHIVHVIETCNEMIFAIIKELIQQESEELHTARTKIVVISHDISNRMYQNWCYRIIDIEAPDMNDFEPGEPAEKLAQDMCAQLLNLGAFFAKNAKEEFGYRPTYDQDIQTKATDDIHERVPEHMPQQTTIGYLVNMDEDAKGCILTMQEYVQAYETPFDVILQSDYTWPLNVRLFPYN